MPISGAPQNVFLAVHRRTVITHPKFILIWGVIFVVQLDCLCHFGFALELCCIPYQRWENMETWETCFRNPCLFQEPTSQTWSYIYRIISTFKWYLQKVWHLRPRTQDHVIPIGAKSISVWWCKHIFLNTVHAGRDSLNSLCADNFPNNLKKKKIACFSIFSLQKIKILKFWNACN